MVRDTGFYIAKAFCCRNIRNYLLSGSPTIQPCVSISWKRTFIKPAVIHRTSQLPHTLNAAHHPSFKNCPERATICTTLHRPNAKRWTCTRDKHHSRLIWNQTNWNEPARTEPVQIELPLEIFWFRVQICYFNPAKHNERRTSLFSMQWYIQMSQLSLKLEQLKVHHVRNNSFRKMVAPYLLIRSQNKVRPPLRQRHYADRTTSAIFHSPMRRKNIADIGDTWKSKHRTCLCIWILSVCFCVHEAKRRGHSNEVRVLNCLHKSLHMRNRKTSVNGGIDLVARTQ